MRLEIHEESHKQIINAMSVSKTSVINVNSLKLLNTNYMRDERAPYKKTPTLVCDCLLLAMLGVVPNTSLWETLPM